MLVDRVSSDLSNGGDFVLVTCFDGFWRSALFGSFECFFARSGSRKPSRNGAVSL